MDKRKNRQASRNPSFPLALFHHEYRRQYYGRGRHRGRYFRAVNFQKATVKKSRRRKNLPVRYGEKYRDGLLT